MIIWDPLRLKRPRSSVMTSEHIAEVPEHRRQGACPVTHLSGLPAGYERDAMEEDVDTACGISWETSPQGRRRAKSATAALTVSTLSQLLITVHMLVSSLLVSRLHRLLVRPSVWAYGGRCSAERLIKNELRQAYSLTTPARGPKVNPLSAVDAQQQDQFLSSAANDGGHH